MILTKNINVWEFSTELYFLLLFLCHLLTSWLFCLCYVHSSIPFFMPFWIYAFMVQIYWLDFIKHLTYQVVSILLIGVLSYLQDVCSFWWYKLLWHVIQSHLSFYFILSVTSVCAGNMAYVITLKRKQKYQTSMCVLFV